MKITVFTPTYNRAYIIENLYRSLQRQTYMDFEWLVVDDGSSDNTSELFAEWKKDNNPFPIRYYYKENGGKCQAINYALDLAEGELFFTVDSDDYLTDDALEKIVSWEASITDKIAYCGVSGNLGISPNETPNTIYDFQYWDGDLLARYPESKREHIIDGERALAFYTEVHRKYRYPLLENEKFMTEAVTWNRMAHDGFKMRFFNDIIWIYEYKEDGLTNAGFRLFENNPRGYALALTEKTKFIDPSFRAIFKCRYSIYCDLKSKYSNNELASIMQIHKWQVDLFAALYTLKHLFRR